MQMQQPHPSRGGKDGAPGKTFYGDGGESNGSAEGGRYMDNCGGNGGGVRAGRDPSSHEALCRDDNLNRSSRHRPVRKNLRGSVAVGLAVGAAAVVVVFVGEFAGGADFEDGADALAAHHFGGRSALLGQPFAEDFELDGVGDGHAFDLDLDVAKFGLEVADPVGAAQEFEGHGQSFVEGAGGDVDRVLDAFGIVERNFAGFEFHNDGA
jgi:hypothetical protein